MAFAHLVLVRHATCIEHQEMVHASTPSPADAALQARRAELAAAEAAPVEDRGHGDDHCLVVASRRRELATQDGGAWQAAPLAGLTAALGAPPTSDQPPPVPLLHLAPKSSPPAPRAS
jgi:hypothetical protein